MEEDTSRSSNPEMGSLTQASPHESRFIGSSSGIYFINTVKQAFESAGYEHNGDHLPPAESTVGGEEDLNPSTSHHAAGYAVTIDQEAFAIDLSAQLGTLPPYATGQQYVIEYFKTWHPLLPFLRGPEFLQEFETLYRDSSFVKGQGHTSIDRRRLCYLVMIQCVMSIGAAVTSEMPDATSAPLTSTLLSLTTNLSDRHDILAIQLLLVAQTYCVSTMGLRTASFLGGLLSKLLYHAGMHRCPYRYSNISDEDRELRKRILWSAYALDRYISQALGIPVSLTNSEIDVCVPGRDEAHVANARQSLHAMEVDGMGGQPRHAAISRESILSNFVDHANLVGRALEMFHVSIHSRNHDRRQVLFLRSDVEKWFNGLPEEPRLSSQSSAAEEQVARFMPFFNVLYEQLVISIHRPSLSLPRSAPEFHHGMQVTIRAAKHTIVAMERQSNLFWPGYVAATWMSGLIISFACQISLYGIAQGAQEINRCLRLLTRMARRWRSAQICHDVLSTLLSDLQRARQTHRRTASEAFSENGADETRAIKQRLIDPALTGSLADDISPVSPQAISETPSASVLSTMPTDNGLPSVPVTFDGVNHWDVNDFFQDLSWNNLFDTNNMGGDFAQQSYPG